MEGPEDLSCPSERGDIAKLVEIVRAANLEAELAVDSDRYQFATVDELLTCEDALSRIRLAMQTPRLEVTITRDELVVEGTEGDATDGALARIRELVAQRRWALVPLLNVAPPPFLILFGLVLLFPGDLARRGLSWSGSLAIVFGVGVIVLMSSRWIGRRLNSERIVFRAEAGEPSNWPRIGADFLKVLGLVALLGIVLARWGC